MIRAATVKDADSIADLYNHYILHTSITFEEDVVNGKDIAQRIDNTQADRLPWLVALDNNEQIIGYAYASKWKGRCAYRYSVEVTVYLSSDSHGKGTGTKLYQKLFSELTNLGIHTVIGGISLPNQASVNLHEKFGMTKVGHFQEVGYKFKRWVDVGYWQGRLKG